MTRKQKTLKKTPSPLKRKFRSYLSHLDPGKIVIETNGWGKSEKRDFLTIYSIYKSKFFERKNFKKRTDMYLVSRVNIEIKKSK